jgi:hypothetical protein
MHIKVNIISANMIDGDVILLKTYDHIPSIGDSIVIDDEINNVLSTGYTVHHRRYHYKVDRNDAQHLESVDIYV